MNFTLDLCATSFISYSLLLLLAVAWKLDLIFSCLYEQSFFLYFGGKVLDIFHQMQDATNFILAYTVPAYCSHMYDKHNSVQDKIMLYRARVMCQCI